MRRSTAHPGNDHSTYVSGFVKALPSLTCLRPIGGRCQGWTPAHNKRIETDWPNRYATVPAAHASRDPKENLERAQTRKKMRRLQAGGPSLTRRNTVLLRRWLDLALLAEDASEVVAELGKSDLAPDASRSS